MVDDVNFDDWCAILWELEPENHSRNALLCLKKFGPIESSNLTIEKLEGFMPKEYQEKFLSLYQEMIDSRTTVNERGTKVPRKLAVNGYDDADVMNVGRYKFKVRSNIVEKTCDGIPIETRLYYGGIERITVKDNAINPRRRNLYSWCCKCRSVNRIHPTKNCGSWDIQKAKQEEKEDLIKIKKQL